tara:strand:+ start:894 stop:2222 length:1329 start_codon:yes stop_codon:yes gene_type:complete
MKLFSFLVILSFLNSCSFDNKSGIWNNENVTANNKNDNFLTDFKKISSSNEIFNEIKKIDDSFIFNIDKPYNNTSWKDIFYNNNNNTKNFKYDNLNQVIFKSKKLTKYNANNYILVENNNLFLTDKKGYLIVYSINENKIIAKLNFYKKKYKKIEKNLNIIIEGETIFISDNFGFIYAYDYQQNKILWAKNYKVPFRSNIKLINDKIITSNQNNDLFIFDKNSGNLIKKIPSEETIINNSFINNIALGNEEIFFLNTYGSLYSINNRDFKLNWFVNLNKTLDLNLSNLFSGSEIVYSDNKIVVSSNDNFYILDSKSGSIITKKNFSPISKPLIINNYIFLITKNSLLISMKLQNGDIIYSYDMNQKVSDFLGTKKKTLQIKSIKIANNKILIFLENSYLIKLDLKGNLIEIDKLPVKINSYPIFINNSLLFLNKKNKLLTIN